MNLDELTKKKGSIYFREGRKIMGILYVTLISFINLFIKKIT